MENFQPRKRKLNKEKIVISIRIDEDILEKIDKLAIAIDISRNEFIMQCIQFALDNLENNNMNIKNNKEE
ncbi:MAG: CopG family transcriptional regulator [Bacilli bacterium]|nr:CopG family transcriptional regulator [Bacilli bacterium]